MLLTGDGIQYFRLCQWKYAIKLEQDGLRFSGGRSVKAFAAEQLGLPKRAKPAVVLAEIERLMALYEQARRDGVTLGPLSGVK